MLTIVIAATLATLQGAAPAEKVNLQFDWPATGSVRVKEELLRKGNRATLDFELSWQPEADGQMVLTHEDVRLTLPGKDMSNPKIRRSVRDAQAMAAVVPQMHVGSDGKIVSFEPIAAAIDRTAADLRRRVDEDVVKRMHAVLARPKQGPLLEAKLSEVWGYWVGEWAGMSVARSSQAQLPPDPSQMGGVIGQVGVQVTDRTEYRGIACVEIIRTSLSDEEVMTAKFLTMMRRQGGESADIAARITRVTGEWMVRGIFSAEGLRPLEVHTSRSKYLWFTNQEKPVEEREDHSYYFAWDDYEPEEAEPSED